LNSWEKVKKILDSYPESDEHIINEAKERKSLIAMFAKIPSELQQSTSNHSSLIIVQANNETKLINVNTL
jgi:hypothetical protein